LSFGIWTLSIIMLGIMTLSIIMLGIMPLSINDIQHKWCSELQHSAHAPSLSFSIMTLSIMTLSISTIRSNRTQDYDAQCCDTEDKCNSVLHNVARHNGLK
jgi:hypothetical protein